jgi:hypothetical protein
LFTAVAIFAGSVRGVVVQASKYESQILKSFIAGLNHLRVSIAIIE